MRHKLLIILGILALLILTRLLHLLNHSYYWIINPDSFFFHHQAQLTSAGQSVPVQGSGLSYFISLSPHWLTVFTPMIMALLTVLVLILYVRKFYSLPEALASAFMFAVLIPAIFITEAGNVDRDGLEVLLSIVALLSFYLIDNLDRKNKSWWIHAILCGFALIALALLWNRIALPIMFSIYMAFIGIALVRQFAPRFAPYIYLILAIIALIGLFYASHKWGGDVAEMQFISPSQIIVYAPLILPLFAGIRHMLRRKRSQDIFLLTWFFVSLIEGIGISRLLLFIIPPVCIISGVGIVSFYREFMEKQKRRVMHMVIGLCIIASLAFSWVNFADVIMPRYWVDACEYVKAETPTNSTVMTWWDNGYWVLDVANRTPYTDNGHYTWDKLYLTAQIYTATDDKVAHDLISGIADYVIMSSIERHYFGTIMKDARYFGDKQDTLWARSLNHPYQSQYFDVVYKSVNGDDAIVVLKVL